MASPSPHVGIIIFLFSHLLLQVSSKEQGGQNCPSTFKCNTIGVHGYPFTSIFYPNCGLCIINCTDQPFPTVRLSERGPWYDVTNSIANNKAFLLSDWHLLHVLNDDMICDDHIFDQISFVDHHLPISPSISFTIIHNVTLWKCTYKTYMSNDSSVLRPIRACGSNNIFLDQEGRNFQNCSSILYSNQLIAEISDQCSKCTSEGGRCQDLKNGGFKCVNRKKGRRKLILLLVLGISGGSIVLILLALVLWYLRTVKLGSSTFASRNISSGPTRTDLDRSKMYFSLPIFSYTELEEATNNFDPTMELGDGGFGTVYYGKLNDGREVAVKRLYERNYRQIEQFMNEIEILTSLRHQNLVSLYGCTSRRSRELLLVYEYVPNGTVADQLHGDQAKCGILTWPIRMSIAIETAKALSYLHASEIIHRDVKSTNILLDNNFGVKVADFGLSRLFPTDVTHVSTVPQGTPGYLDPEYNQCYQLTGKSDVYSFGVVLVELISSLPAIDISRKDDEVNLSCYAMKRIQCCAFGELVDPRLGFESNYKVKRMTVLVAELAFRCLQHKKEFRPSMDEVLEALKSIECADYEKGDENCDGRLKRQTDDEYVWLLRNSPNSVMHKWGSSKSITPAASG